MAPFEEESLCDNQIPAYKPQNFGDTPQKGWEIPKDQTDGHPNFGGQDVIGKRKAKSRSKERLRQYSPIPRMENLSWHFDKMLNLNAPKVETSPMRTYNEPNEFACPNQGYK